MGVSRVREEENPPSKVWKNEKLIPIGLEGVGQVEKGYVSDLLRTQVGVLGGRPQGYIRCPGRCSFGQWARGFMQDSGGQPSRVISFAVGGERVQLSANAPSRNGGPA